MTTMWHPGPALGGLRGTVLELGPGWGPNLRHYAPGVRWIGVEPNARRRAVARQEAARLGRAVTVLAGRAERLDLADDSVDAVVGTFVLCSVRDPAAALAEVRRVLRPGGRFVFVEHVAAPRGTWLRVAQHVWTAGTRLTSAACRGDRDTGPAIERAGFRLIECHEFTEPGPLGTAIPHIAGTAVPAVREGETR